MFIFIIRSFFITLTEIYGSFQTKNKLSFYEGRLYKFLSILSLRKFNKMFKVNINITYPALYFVRMELCILLGICILEYFYNASF